MQLEQIVILRVYRVHSTKRLKYLLYCCLEKQNNKKNQGNCLFHFVLSCWASLNPETNTAELILVFVNLTSMAFIPLGVVLAARVKGSPCVAHKVPSLTVKTGDSISYMTQR